MLVTSKTEARFRLHCEVCGEKISSEELVQRTIQGSNSWVAEVDSSGIRHHWCSEVCHSMRLSPDETLVLDLLRKQGNVIASVLPGGSQ